VGWVALVTVATVWGSDLVERRPKMRINAAPFAGRWDIVDMPAIGPAVALALAAVALGPFLARRAPWRVVVVGAAGLAVAWLLALNHVDGPDALERPLTTRYEYLAGVPDIDAAGGPVDYLRSFTDRIADHPTHVRGHPPGMVVMLWAVGRTGLDRLDVAIALVLAGWAAAIAATLTALRDVAGEAAARRAGPVLALLPGAVWAGTSMDAFYTGLTAVGIAGLVAATGAGGDASNRRADLLAAGGGGLLGVALLCSYGTVPALAIPVIIAFLRRRIRPLVVAGIAAAALLAVAAAAGFWWLDGLRTTRDQYELGLASLRPYRYWVVGNLAAVAVATGPVLGAGVARVGRRAGLAGALLTGALVAVAATDLSGLSKGEVERIWLVFVPWLATAAALVPAGRHDLGTRAWVAAQAATAITIQVALRSPW
jgi:hypothetical protein